MKAKNRGFYGFSIFSDKKIEKDFSPSVFSKIKKQLTLPF